jgi:fluoroquinolone transport system permease protein
VSRLTATLRLDAQIQTRNRIYWIVGIAALGLGLALRALFSPQQLHFFMPLLVLSGVGITAFVLAGVLLLLERGEGTLDALRVSPLRPGEYLASKILTLGALALVEAGLIASVAYGFGFSLGWLAVAVMLRAGLACAVGVAIGVRYRSITRFLLPVAAVSAAIDLPVLWYLELWPTSLFYLWPSLPSLLVAKAAFYPVDPSELVYACAYGALAFFGALLWARRSIERFVVRGELHS